MTTSTPSTPSIDSIKDLSLENDNVNVSESVSGSTSDSLDHSKVVSPAPSSTEKSGNTSSTSTTSLSSSTASSSKSRQKQPIASPPPLAFSNLPLSAGTIRPPSFNTPMKPEKSSDGLDKEDDVLEKKVNDNVPPSNDDKEDIGNEVPVSSPLTEQSSLSNYAPATKVKGINEYLSRSEGGQKETVNDSTLVEETTISPNLNKESDATSGTPKMANFTLDSQSEIQQKSDVEPSSNSEEFRFIKDQETQKMRRRNSEITVQAANSERNSFISVELDNTDQSIDDEGKLSLDDNDDSITSSITNSNPRSLLPRSLNLTTNDNNGSRVNALRGRGFVDIGGASITPSILSSQGSSSKESRDRILQNDTNRMKHLGMLLDRHHHQIKGRKRNNIASETWWQYDDDSSVEKDFASASLKEKNSGEGSRDGIKSAESSDAGPISMHSSDRSNSYPNKSVLGKTYRQSSTDPFGDASHSELSSKKSLSRRYSLSNSSSSSQDPRNRKNNDSLFETFDKTWQSFHKESDDDSIGALTLDKPIAREQICFASMVLVLLRQIPRENPDAETHWSKSVPIEIVRLFWEEVIFSTEDGDSSCAFITLPSSCDLKSITTIIEDVLLNKLRYISTDVDSSVSKADDLNSSFSVKLSHEVYAEYSKHILKQYDVLPENCLNKWNAKFVTVLKSALDSHFGQPSETTQKYSQQVLTYAASYIPKLVFLSIHLEISDGDGSAKGSKEDNVLLHQRDRVNFIYSLMKNSEFLYQRMKVLGGNSQHKCVPKDESNSEGIKRFQSESYFERVDVDALEATRVHIEDLESINIILSMMSREFFLDDDVIISDTTDAMISLYKAWKELCLSLLQHNVQTQNSLHALKVDDSNDKTRNGPGSKAGPIIQSSERTQQSIPKCFRLQPGEYELQVLGSTTSFKKTTTSDLNQKENTRRSRHQEAKTKACATMRLSHVLQIDPASLYHYLSVGKSINLLGESIFDTTYYTAEKGPTYRGLKHLLGSAPNATSINFIASSIDIYMQLTHLISFILSSDIGDVDEDDLIDMGYRYDQGSGKMDPSLRMRKLLEDRTEARVMFEKLNILCAESWLALGTYLMLGLAEGHGAAIETAGLHLLNRLEMKDIIDVDPSHNSQKDFTDEIGKVDAEKLDSHPKHPLQPKILLCFQMALGVLLHNNSCSQEQISSFKPDLTSIVIYARNLRAAIIHSIGVHYYEQISDYERSKIYLDSSLAIRRLLLRLIQRDDPDDLGSLSGSSMNRGYKRRYQRQSRRGSNRHSRQKTKPKETQPTKKNRLDVILKFEMNRKKQISVIEKGLSTTLECSAFTSHCLFDYDASLSLFQDALILRAQHSGKESLEVASLQYNMGVIHDDLGQYEASLGRYGESLRVRFSLLENLRGKTTLEYPFDSSALEFFELETNVILTLRCMANVYRVLNDATNAIGCLMKAIELLKDKLRRGMSETNRGLYQSIDGDIGFGKGMILGLAMPKIILTELKENEDASKLHPTSSDFFSKEQLRKSDEGDDAIRREISSMYKTMISLLHERSAQRTSFRAGGKSGYISNSSSYTRGSFTKSTRSNEPNSKKVPTKKGLDANSDNDSIHLDSAFNLGLLALHFRDQKNALSHFEDALRTLWTSFSGDSSGESSDSDYSKSSSSRSAMKKKPNKIYFEGQVEEGALYHALAIAHASLSDHERAVRCYVTALRYYRRRFGLECPTVAGALYDCAFSYWKLGDNDRAEDFWADCLKILLCGGEKEENKPSLSPIYDLHVARTLYNLAATKICKGEYNDRYISTCLNDATSIFKRLSDKDFQNFHEEIGHCLYYSSFLHYKKSLSMAVISNGNTEASSKTSIEDSICKEEHLNHALFFIDKSLHNYLSESGSLDIGLEQVEVGQKLQHPMQAHIAHLSAWIHDALGSVTQAQWNYKIAIRLLNKVYSPENLYSASAMHSLANLYLSIGNSQEALQYYKESLVRRAQILGSDHSAVADTLFQMAGIIGDAQQYSKASSMFSHCLTIRIRTEGNDGDNVAETLLNLALLHDKNGHCRKAKECLEGALKVRKSRLQGIIHSCIANVEKSVDKNFNDAEESVQKVTRVEQMKLAYIMHNLGNVLLKIGDIEDAMSFFNEALDLRRKLIGIDDGGFAMFVNRDDFESLLELNRDMLREMADTLHNLGGVFETKSMQQKALSCYNQALIIKRSTSKEKQVAFSLDDQIKSCNTLSSAFTLLRIGAIHNELHNHDVGLSYYKSAVNIQRQHLGRDHIAVAQTLVDMGLILRRQLESPIDLMSERTPLEQAATKYFNEALRISKMRNGSNHVSVAGIMYHIGSMHDQGGNYTQAINHYQHSVKVYGREYAKTLCKSLFNVSSVQCNQYDCIVDNDHGLFHPMSLRNNLLPLENNTSVVFSRGIVKNSTRVTDIDREAYLRASLALAQVATRSGFIWLHGSSFQNFLFRVLHFISTNGVDPIRDTLQNNIRNMMNHFAKASTHAVITVKDAPQNNYLYLINE